uniref:Uncharacterized protein n=1 Tax=Anguilla anguilla TaxID=7936 RepID=A0A0E9S904_ANGAN
MCFDAILFWKKM